MAYNDLQIQRVLRDVKATTKFTHQDIIERYFDNWESRYDDLLSSDPCSFPGFRLSIEGSEQWAAALWRGHGDRGFQE